MWEPQLRPDIRLNIEHRDNITFILFCSTDLNVSLSRTPNSPRCLFLALSLAKLFSTFLTLIHFLTCPLPLYYISLHHYYFLNKTKDKASLYVGFSTILLSVFWET